MRVPLIGTPPHLAVDHLPAASTLSAPVVVALAIGGAVVATRLSGFVVRRIVRRVADRSQVRPSRWWRTRSRRTTGESTELVEQRRSQRIDAASRMVNHAVSLIVWLAVTITVFKVLEIDAAFFLSSAGFLGAAIAIGGQHKMNDYLTGLLVHLEDRYGVGDEVEFDAGGDDRVRAVVDHVGLFSTRVRDERSTMHVPNAAMAQVRNLSQESAAATLRVRSNGRSVEEVEATLRRLAGSTDLTEVVFLGDIAAHQPVTGEVEVDVHTLRPLGQATSQRLVERAELDLERDR